MKLYLISPIDIKYSFRGTERHIYGQIILRKILGMFEHIQRR